MVLIRVLAFWEAYPGLRHAGDEIDSFAVDSGMKTVRTMLQTLRFTEIYPLQVVAAMGSRIACWSLIGGRAEIWRIYSTLVLPKDTTVMALDCKSGNSILFAVIIIHLCEDLMTRIACYCDKRRPVCPYLEPRGRHSVVGPEVEVSVCGPFRFLTLIDIGVSVVPLSRIRFTPSLMFIVTTALVRSPPPSKPHVLDPFF